VCCFAALALLFASAAARSDAAYTDLLIGTGIWDVTGTAAEGMLPIPAFFCFGASDVLLCCRGKPFRGLVVLCY
jgi:hypothetical protein